MVVDLAAKAWAKLQEFMGRVDTLEKESEETQSEVVYLRRELELLRKEMQHNDKVSVKVQEHQGLKLAELEQRLKKVESEKHGAKVSAGRAKAENKRLKEELNGPKDQRRRH